jgi:hypothetical protein
LGRQARPNQASNPARAGVCGHLVFPEEKKDDGKHESTAKAHTHLSDGRQKDEVKKKRTRWLLGWKD